MGHQQGFINGRKKGIKIERDRMNATIGGKIGNKINTGVDKFNQGKNLVKNNVNFNLLFFLKNDGNLRTVMKQLFYKNNVKIFA